MRRPAAVLWDMDGTLIDSEPIWIAQQFALVDRHGGTWSHRQGLELVGSDMHKTADAMRAAGVVLEDTAIIATLEAGVMEALASSVPWRPGVLELLRDLASSGIAAAIVTTSSHEMADLVACSAPDGTFTCIVGSQDVSRSKPHPEPYLEAARLLDVGIADCVAIEDSPNGLASAVASGAVAIAVPNDAPLPAPGSWHVWPTLQGRIVADLEGLVRSR
ncbi:HAD family hydrolase [Nocardioides sp. AX2bis]|uniref:HAD family hydrolase n=1 Tax=Nocardioides sp. AX2bis TaxID=2653157 RepID=UPI0012F0A64D|nr:HAD family phosphatase [Nocardioides sp. AX2bis]VXC47415.1 Haloacid dehalogenase superfamily, subfamily IA, variant 3 with third motif having DD or ED [Nocardioides sp. AX2bis]